MENMSSFQPYPDLPQIKVFQDSISTDPDNLSIYSLDNDLSKLDPAEGNAGRLGTTANRTAELQLRLLNMEKSVAGHPQIYTATRDAGDSSFSCYPALGAATLPDRHELQPRTGPNARYMSPSGSWGGDRSGTEVDSSPSEGSRSPRSVWAFGSPYMQQEYTQDSLTFSPNRQIYHQAMETTEHPFPAGDQPSFCHSVTPQEIQHYPDPESESAPYGLRHPERNTGVCYDEVKEREEVSPRVGMNQGYEDDEDDEELYPPTKMMKFTTNLYAAADPPTTRSLSRRNKPKPAATPRTSRPNTRDRARGGGRAATGKAKPAHQNVDRLFVCSFSHYGCPSTFQSKNEWKRHVTSQHLKLGFFQCDVGFCNPTKGRRSVNTSGATGHRYNRKDLFTQHQRRMHKPQALIKNPSERLNTAFETSLEDVRQRCWIESRQPPMRSDCGFCDRHFEGVKSWEDRMEHVGKHFENGDREEYEDEALREWALEEGLIQPSEDGRLVLTGN